MLKETFDISKTMYPCHFLKSNDYTEENKHFLEGYQGDLTQPNLIFPFVRAEHTVLLSKDEYGRVVFFSSVLLSSINFFKHFFLVTRISISKKIADELYHFLCSPMQSELVNQGEPCVRKSLVRM